MHEEMIPKVLLFEMGDPTFVISIVRCLRPQIFMARDYIIRQGDYAEEMYFIKVGIVEVISSNSELVVAYLDEGEYFGEIGILLNLRRTVSVRAHSATMISSIKKEDLLPILNNFPEYNNFLLKVAEQRLKTTKSEDLDVYFDLQIDESSDSSESSEEDTVNPPQHVDHSEKN